MKEAVIACSHGVKLVHVELGVKTPGLKTGPCGLEVKRRQVLKPVHVDWKWEEAVIACSQGVGLVPVDLKGEDVRS